MGICVVRWDGCGEEEEEEIKKKQKKKQKNTAFEMLLNYILDICVICKNVHVCLMAD